MVATLKIIKKLNHKIVKTMQQEINTTHFYNFRNKFSYNFERSDPKKERIMKKVYVKPQMVAVKINQRENLLTDSVNSNAFQGRVTKSSGPGRSRGCDWDDEEDW